MKIALVSQEYPPETAQGGIGSQTYAKAQGLSLLGHRVFVIARSVDAERHENIYGNVCVIRIPDMEDRLPEMTDIVYWITRSVAVAAEIEALHKRVGLDIIDFPEWAAEAYVYLLNRTERNMIPVVIQLHGPLVMLGHTIGWPDMDSAFYRTGIHMEATCVQMADAVYSSSECSAQWIRSHYNTQKENIPVIHLGVDTTKFAPQPVPKEDRPTIVFVGRIAWSKGVEELVEAASHLVKEFPRLQLRIIGRGEENFVKRLQAKAEKLRAPLLLNFPGFINKEHLPQELSRAHIFAAPSYYEGGPGFVYLEAMACGLPVVGCSGSGVEEIIISEENGLLVPPKNAKALEEALRTMLSNKSLLENMSLNARNFIIKEADSLYCLKRLESFYHMVLRPNSVELEAAL